MEDNNNITWHAGMVHTNKMLKKEYQNNSYQNTNRDDNLLIPIFYFLQISFKQKELANNN